MEKNEIEHSMPHELLNIVEYVERSVVIKSVLRKRIGTVSVSSFDTGEALASKISPFDCLIQVIDGVAEIIINEQSTQLKKGQLMIIPAHSTHKMKANERFKIISTIIKSGYGDINP